MGQRPYRREEHILEATHVYRSAVEVAQDCEYADAGIVGLVKAVAYVAYIQCIPLHELTGMVGFALSDVEFGLEKTNDKSKKTKKKGKPDNKGKDPA